MRPVQAEPTERTHAPEKTRRYEQAKVKIGLPPLRATHRKAHVAVKAACARSSQGMCYSRSVLTLRWCLCWLELKTARSEEGLSKSCICSWV